MAQTNQTNTRIDELVVRDADGKFKILRGGKLEEWEGGAAGARLAPRPSAGAPPATRARDNLHTRADGLDASALSSPRIPHIEPRVQAPEKPVSRHYINVNDEEEIGAIRNKSDEAYALHIVRLADEKAEAIARASGLSLDVQVRPRLHRAIVSRLKDVRNLTETKDVLTRATALGGVGLDAGQAQRMLKQIEAARAEFEEEMRAGTLKETKSGAQPPIHQAFEIHQEIPARKPQIPISKPQLITEIPTTKTALEELTPMLPVKPFVHPSYQKTEDKNRTPDGKAPSPVPRLPTADIRLPTSGARQQIEEVRAKPKIMGPVEELRSFTLEDFRRLGASAAGAAHKVQEKVELLADESLVMRSQGVTAWKSSPVHQLYLALGRECMEKGVTVKSVINDWAARQRPALTPEEFDAIADLNQKLAY